MFPAHCRHKEKKAKGVQPGTSKVYLIKWLVSVHCKNEFMLWCVYLCPNMSAMHCIKITAQCGYYRAALTPTESSQFFCAMFEKGASVPPPFLALSASAIVPAMWTSQQSKNVPFLSKYH